MRRRPRRGQEPPADIAPQDRLESWKEIAAYLHRDIRTVQRWELFEGLPIHRHMHLKRGSVYAFREELETWWANRRHDLNGDSKPAEAAAGSSPATSLPPRAERATSDDPEQRARLTATRLENPRRPHRLGQVAIAAMLVGLAGFSIGFVARHNSGAGKPAAAPRLLVLPFQVRDGREGAEYAGQALAEAIAIELSRVEGIRVLPVPQAAEVAGGSEERTRAAETAGADRLLTGSLVQDRETMQATLNLVDVKDGHIVWGVQQDAAHSDLQMLAAAFAHEVARRMDVHVVKQYGTIEEFNANPVLVSSPLWTRALGALSRRDSTTALSATDSLVMEFPREAEARAARCRALLLSDEMATAGTRRATSDAIDALAQIDPEHPRVAQWRVKCGAGLTISQRITTLGRLLQRNDLSVALRASILQNRIVFERGLPDLGAAIQDAQELAHLEPASPTTFSTLADLLLLQGQYEAGLQRARQAFALDPSSHSANLPVGWALLLLGRAEESVPYLKAACQEGTGISGEMMLARALYLTGKTKEAAKLVSEAEARPENFDTVYEIACFHAAIGDRPKALNTLRRAVDLGWKSSFMRRDPDLTSLRGDPEFEKILQDAGDP